MRPWLAALVAVALVAACSGSDSDPTGVGGGTTTGTGGTGGATSVTTGTGSPSSGTEAIPCDYEGVCGDNVEPACQGCALDTECNAALVACQDEPAQACLDLNKCRLDCPDGPDFEACIAACDAQHPAGAALLNALLVCVFCQACPVSCATKAEDCP